LTLRVCPSPRRNSEQSPLSQYLESSLYRSEGLNSWFTISNSMLASTIGKRSRRDTPGAAAEACCVDQGKDRGVMVDEGPPRPSSAWVGGMAAGIFLRIKAS